MQAGREASLHGAGLFLGSSGSSCFGGDGRRIGARSGGSFGVSAASAVKWTQRFRLSGSAAARPVGGRKPFVLVGEREWLLRRIAEAPDLTLRALQAELAERGVSASYHAVWDFFAHEGVTFKKKPARHRAGPTGRGPQAGALETPPSPA
jgi:transposase